MTIIIRSTTWLKKKERNDDCITTWDHADDDCRQNELYIYIYRIRNLATPGRRERDKRKDSNSIVVRFINLLHFALFFERKNKLFLYNIFSLNRKKEINGERNTKKKKKKKSRNRSRHHRQPLRSLGEKVSFCFADHGAAIRVQCV